MDHKNLAVALVNYTQSADNSKSFELVDEKIIGYDFFQLDLGAGALVRSVFENCFFRRVNLYDAHLTESQFIDTVFVDCDLSITTIYKTRFINCLFIQSKLIKCDALETMFKNTTSVKCDFKLFDFGSAIIENMRFIEASNLDVGVVQGSGIQVID